MTTRRWPRPDELREILRPAPLVRDRALRRIARAHTIDDLRRIARRRTPRAVFDYVDGAAEAEESLARSRAAFGSLELVPRVLRDVSRADLSTTLLGTESTMPLVFAPTGFTRMMHHVGEPAVARVAERVGIPYALSTMGTTSPEDVAAAAPGATRWFQLYVWRDREASSELIARAAAAGYTALVLTVDTPVAGMRARDARNGLTIPPTLSLRTFVDGARHPEWWFNLLTTEPLSFASLDQHGGGLAAMVNRMFDPAVTFADVAWLRDAWPGKLVVKGIQHPDDARQAVDHGADAVVVSNHGGRQLDRSPTPLEQLPHVVAAIGERAEVMLDGGILRGADVVAAVALGARACLVGRAYLYGLMAAGEPGVQRAADVLRGEMRRTMQLLGVTSVADLHPELVRLR